MRYLKKYLILFLLRPKTSDHEKLLLLFIVFNAITPLSFSLDEFAKLQAEFKKMMKDPKNIYGKNKIVAK